MPHSHPQTCLSATPHDGRISDIIIHYFGCLPRAKRPRFFASLPPESQQRIRREEKRVSQLRDRLQARPESDAAARLAQFRATIGEYRNVKGWGKSNESQEEDYNSLEAGSIDTMLKAPVIYFKGGQPHQSSKIPGQWPHQKVMVSDLLDDNERSNPLMQPCEDDMVRYFHLPANNMVWVEEVMARYYHEQRPEHNDLFMNCKLGRNRTKTEMLLRTEFWQGQQNFNQNSEVHARHMRPFCDAISIDPISKDPHPKNVVLFMPYLHWETDRGRESSAEIIKDATKDNMSSIAEVVNEAQHRLSKAQDDQQDMATQLQQLHSLRPVVSTATEGPTRRKLLGDVLKQAANLLESMELYAQDQLVREYLYCQSPLHPRRTLDQSYYGALRNTGSRDRDQVVYRATTPQPHECYEHLEEKIGKCRQCQEDIRMVPRLIMVDQLWLWILDDKTVISSFPRRFGKNKPDPGAVHKSLRLRLKYSRAGEINSAYDLALIIIDECSRVFFDRTRINTRVPNLVDIFADAIRGVTYKQTAAFDQFLIYTHLASREYKRDLGDTDLATQNTLLNINPEGNLLKEAKDIMDEIHIITRIKAQQQIVMESFVKHIRQVLGPTVRLSNKRRSFGMRRSGAVSAIVNSYADLTGEESDENDDEREKKERAKWTLSRADQLLVDIQERIFELETLLENAMNTSSHLKDLLTLKQQQAGVIEAREACKQAAETVKQGRSIMLFTVITIVFLPLSFVATIFGMNALDFEETVPSLHSELVYMFSISAGIIAVSFILAFSRSALNNSFTHLVHNSWSLAFNTLMTWISVKTGMHMVSRSMAIKANALKDKENKITGQMKANVMREKSNLEKIKAMQHISGIDNKKDDDDASSTMTGKGTFRRLSSRPTGLTSPSKPVLLTPMATGMPESPASPFSPGAASPFFRSGRTPGQNGREMEDVELGRRPASQGPLVPGQGRM
ncbi:Magnesium transport protein CorA [Zalerion maritima]|uniref:Magnesium transport protein CorA n=1 Tax=Zalerion maritima TaxID=339359 RepID=A0AAD5WUU8_9PEZI|nr:Magnesium transport protein CorA [Zalerion maritima]